MFTYHSVDTTSQTDHSCKIGMYFTVAIETYTFVKSLQKHVFLWDSLGPSPALALYHIAAQSIEFEKR